MAANVATMTWRIAVCIVMMIAAYLFRHSTYYMAATVTAEQWPDAIRQRRANRYGRCDSS